MSEELETRKLAIEERRMEAEIEARRQQFDLQVKELELKEREFERSSTRSFSPGATALIAGVLSILTATITSYFGGMWTLQAQREKNSTELALLEKKTKADIDTQKRTAEDGFRLKEQERQFQILVKATEDRSPRDAANNLLFFVDIGYLPDPENKIREKATKGSVPVISSGDSSTRQPIWKLYEGRFGNTEPGDAKKYVGRGYMMTTGKALYAWASKIAGVDLVSAPEKLADPTIAAKVLVDWFVDRKDRVIAAIKANDYARAQRLVTGSTIGAEQVKAKTAIYLHALSSAPGDIPSLPDDFNQEWALKHVPVIVAEMNTRGLQDKDLRAFILATADRETNQGKFMTEIIR